MGNAIDIHLGARLRRTREFRGLSQRELALALGLTAESLDRIERGATRLAATVLFAAGQRLGVDPSFFFRGLKGVETEPAVRKDNVVAFRPRHARPGVAGVGERPPKFYT